MAWIETRRTKKGEPRYLVGWREPGTPKVVRESRTRLEDARALRADVERRISRGEYTSQADRMVSLEAYLRAMIEGDWTIRESTRYAKIKTFEKWIAETPFGRMALGQVKTTDVRSVLANVVGDAARANVYRLLAWAFNRAVREGVLARSPAAALTERPSGRRAREIEPLPITIVEQLAEATDPRYNSGVSLAAYAGLRAGEVGGLRWQDVDVREKRITIVQAVSREGGKRVLGPVKTRASRRTLYVGTRLIQELYGHAELYRPAPDGRIFQTPRGNLVDATTLNAAVHAGAKRAGLPSINFHLLRHTCAALLIRSGAQGKQIQAYMGHSSIQMTLDVYGHLFPSDEGDLASRMEALRAEEGSQVAVMGVSSGDGGSRT